MTHASLELKPGVRLHGLIPEMTVAVQIVRDFWDELGADKCVITACIDGTHAGLPCPSGHYTGRALDFRTHSLPQSVAPHFPAVIEELKRRLGVDFFVLLENMGKDDEHLHVEFRPSQPY